MKRRASIDGSSVAAVLRSRPLACGQIGSTPSSGSESPEAKTTTSWPRARSAVARTWVCRSSPPAKGSRTGCRDEATIPMRTSARTGGGGPTPGTGRGGAGRDPRDRSRVRTRVRPRGRRHAFDGPCALPADPVCGRGRRRPSDVLGAAAGRQSVRHVHRQRPLLAFRVASVPATHVYVRRLAHPAVERLRDPSGDDHRTPCFLDPDWWDAPAGRPPGPAARPLRVRVLRP